MNKDGIPKRYQRKIKMNKRTRLEIERDRAYCSELFLKGYTYREIAKRLSEKLIEWHAEYTIGWTQVFQDIQAMLIEWKRSRLENIDQYVTAELQKLDRLEVEAWEAWEKSKQEKETKSMRQTDNGTSKELRKEDMYGNPKYLDLLLNIQQRRAKLLGYDAPVKIDLTGKQVEEQQDYHIEDIPQDMLYKVADMLQEGQHRRLTESKAN